MKILIGILLMISMEGNAAILRPRGSGSGGSSISTATFVNGAGSGETNKLAKWLDPTTLTTTNWFELNGNLMSTGSITASSGTFSGEVKAATFNAVGTAYQMRSTTLIDTGMNLTVASGTFTGTITAPGMNFSSSGSTMATNGVFTISTSPTAGTAGNVAFQINQNGIITSTTQYRARLRAATLQSIPNSAVTPIFFSNEDTDVGNMHSVVASSQNITIPVDGGGWYAMTCTIEYEGSVVGTRYTVLSVNGVEKDTATQSPLSSPLSLFGATQLHLNGGDVVTCAAFQSSGGSLGVNPNARNTFTIVKIW